MSRIAWEKGVGIMHRGEFVYAAEENGRRFWVTVQTDRGDWSFRDEHSSAEEGMRKIDDRFRSLSGEG